MSQPSGKSDFQTDIELTTQSKGSSEAQDTPSFGQHSTHAKQALTTSEAWIGDYDYKA